MASVLEQLRGMTKVVADTGDLDAVRTYKPIDCTTNPSLVLKAFESPDSAAVLEAEIAEGRGKGLDTAQIAAKLPIALGAELSELVPGRISTEVEADLSFDADASVARALEIMAEYDRRGIGADRILIKLAATWEGIRAAEILQKQGVDCNLTLIFSLSQARGSADAGAYLISPFVGRITDWFKKAEGVDHYDAAEDPGVLSVKTIYEYYKARGIETVVMGASFRNPEQIKALAGCDNLTISPQLLEALGAEEADLPRALSADGVAPAPKQVLSEPEFRWDMAMDAMANELLAKGIKGFDVDLKKMLARIG